MDDFGARRAAYYTQVRYEIEPYLPESADQVLDVGCASGATLSWLKNAGRANKTTGIERYAPAADLASKSVDEVFKFDVERDRYPEALGCFDLILCLDVLECLVQPRKTVDTLVRSYLKPGGTIITIVPNVRQHGVLLPLILRGRWDYREDGPLDRSNLHFFTRDLARELMKHPMLVFPTCSGWSASSTRTAQLVNELTPKVIQDFLATHFILTAKKASA